MRRLKVIDDRFHTRYLRGVIPRGRTVGIAPHAPGQCRNPVRRAHTHLLCRDVRVRVDFVLDLACNLGITARMRTSTYAQGEQKRGYNQTQLFGHDGYPPLIESSEGDISGQRPSVSRGCWPKVTIMRATASSIRSTALPIRIKSETVDQIIEVLAGCCPATQRNHLQPRSSVAMRTAARRCARHDPPKDTAWARSLARKSAGRATTARPDQTGHE